MRLIDADALKKEIHRYALDVYCINLENSKEFAGSSTSENYCEGLYETTELIDYAATIDAEPVRYGHWHIDESDGSYSCKCGLIMWVSDLIDGDANYCPNCGAKMNEVSE